MSRAATVAWWAILGGSLVAIGAGFASGRSYGTAALRPVPPPPRVVAPPAAMRVRDLARTLHGARSLDPADDDPDRYGDPDRAVAARPPGPLPPFDPGRDRPRIAVLVVDADRSASSALAFAQEPFPLALALGPEVAAEDLQALRDAGKTVLVACDGVEAAAVAAERRAGAAGILCSAGDRARATALVTANSGGIVVDDLLAGDELLRAARHRGVPALGRDVVADARDEPVYVAFLLGQALAIARRTGIATVALHARASSRDSLERFAVRAERDGVDLVDVAGIGRR
jgi:Divergent polysaccharide deacetylase